MLQVVFIVKEKLSHKRRSNKAQICTCFRNHNSGAIHPGCALHINNSASGSLSSCFTPLVIISLPLMVLCLYCVQ